jgi:hypothetical protein
MFSRKSAWALFAAAGVVLAIAGWIWSSDGFPNRSGDPRDSIVRFACGPFVAGCRVQVKELVRHDYLGRLPMETYLPARVSLARLNAAGVEELAFLCGPSADSARGDEMEWAAAIRLAEPLQLTEGAERWRRLMPRQAPDRSIEPTALTLNGQACFQLPAGSFLPPPRKWGELRFFDRGGELADRGINVGDVYERRGYVEAGTQGAAVFTFHDLSQNDLVDGQLPLEIRPVVFRTQRLKTPFPVVQLELRNPDDGLRSEPITFQAESHANQEINVPASLAIAGDANRKVNIVDAFVSGGRLEVALRPLSSGAYLGVGPLELNVKVKASEYVFISGREIVVAQSKATLERMLSAAPGPLADRLAFEGSLVIAADIHDESSRSLLQSLLQETAADHHLSQLLHDELTELQVNIDAQGPARGKAVAEFESRGAAQRVQRELAIALADSKQQTGEWVEHALGSLGVGNKLASLGMDGINFQFPLDESETFEERKSFLRSLVDGSFDGLQLDRSGTKITIDFQQPAGANPPSDIQRIALANLDEIIARDLYDREKFDLGDDRYRRVTESFPQVPQTWFRRAHQLSYNTSVKFDGDDNRYAWVRRGIEVLLDGSDANPESTDLMWMAARTIGLKIGYSDDSDAYRRLLAQDERLHKRLSGMIDLEQAKSPVVEIDNWLVARLLFEHCLEQHAAGKTSTIPPLLFYSRPAATQARYAEMLGNAGRDVEAARAWKEAEQMHHELGATEIMLSDSEQVRLGDLPDRLAELGAEHPSVKRLQAARQRILYDYWLLRCKLEQTEEIRSARSLAWQADQRARESQTQQAIELYRDSLLALAEMQQLAPQEGPLVLGEFKYIAAAYKALAEKGNKLDAEIDEIVTQIETSPGYSDYPLVENSPWAQPIVPPVSDN